MSLREAAIQLDRYLLAEMVGSPRCRRVRSCSCGFTVACRHGFAPPRPPSSARAPTERACRRRLGQTELLLATPVGRRVEAHLFRDPDDPHAPHLLDAEVLRSPRRYALRGDVLPERAEQSVQDLLDFRLRRHEHTVFANLLAGVLEVHRDPERTTPGRWRYTTVRALKSGTLLSPLAAPRARLRVADYGQALEDVKAWPASRPGCYARSPATRSALERRAGWRTWPSTARRPWPRPSGHPVPTGP